MTIPRATCLVSACSILAASALAQPAMVIVGMSSADISADGMTAVGAIYHADVDEYYLHRFTRGSAPTNTNAIYDDATIRADAAANSICFGAYNLEDLGALGTNRTIAHKWSAALGNVNLGLASNGNRCDFNINSTYDISGDGRYVSVSGWTNGTCGPFRSWRVDTTSGTFLQLPVTLSPPPASAVSTAVRGNAINADGSVLCGYDQNYNAALTQVLRRAVAWVRNTNNTWTTTILDPNGGEAYAVNASGTFVVGQMSATTAAANPPSSEKNVQRWARSGTSPAWVWTRTDLGRPVDRGLQSAGGDGPVSRIYPGAISDDGNTITGFCEYLDPGAPIAQTRRRPFIWKPSINAGVPIDLQDYVTSLAGGSTLLNNLFLNSTQSLSADGNAMLVTFLNSSNPCLTSGGAAILYLNGTTCEVPRIAFSPVSQASANPGGSLGIILNVSATGSVGLSYQWQKEGTPGEWADLADDNCTQFNALNYDIKGSVGSQLRLGYLSGNFQGNYRCVVTSACGSATSAPAFISCTTCAIPCDSIDFNADGVSPDSLDIDDFLSVFGGGACSNDPLCGDIDFNNDGVSPDSTDIDKFLDVFGGGAC